MNLRNPRAQELGTTLYFKEIVLGRSKNSTSFHRNSEYMELQTLKVGQDQTNKYKRKTYCWMVES